MTTALPTPLLFKWTEAQGQYRGDGMNHMDERFEGRLTLKCEFDQALLELSFQACDPESKAVFHDERTWITEDLMTRQIALWTVSTNTPGVLQHLLTQDQSDGSYVSRMTFQLGDPADKSRFRQRIELSLRKDGKLEYVYSWGVPHEDFGVRSRCLLSRG